MQKLMLISILAATFLLPLTVRDASVHGFRRLSVRTALFMAAYVFAIIFIYPRLS